MRAARLERIAVSLAIVPALLGLVGLRSASRGQAEMAASDRAFEAGEWEPALDHARRAAGAYLPGADHVEAAYLRLRALAQGAEERGDLALATRSWEAVRASARETHHLWLPHALDVELADAELGRLRVVAGASALTSAAPRAPQPVWALVLSAGFLGAGASLFWFCARVWNAAGVASLARARWPVLGWCAGMLALVWALLHA